MPFVFECVASIAPPQALALQGATLPAALMGQSYSTSILGQASGGISPLVFSQLADQGPGVYSTSPTGVITGTPAVSNIRVDSTGAYRTDNLGNLRVTT